MALPVWRGPPPQVSCLDARVRLWSAHDRVIKCQTCFGKSSYNDNWCPPLHIERDEMQLPSSSSPREEAIIIQLPLCSKYHHCHCRCRHSTAPQPNHIVIHSQSATKEEKRGVGGCFSHQLQQQVGQAKNRPPNTCLLIPNHNGRGVLDG